MSNRARRALRPALLLLAAAASAGGGPSEKPQGRKTFEAGVLDVTLSFSVTDGAGRPVLDLSAEEIALTEDGAPQSIRTLDLGRPGASIILAIDSSESMTYRMDDALSAARDFIDLLREDDGIAVIDFDSEVRLLGSFGGGRSGAIAALRDVTAGGATLLYDAIVRAEEALSGRPGRRVVVVLSDGEDGSFDGGSRHRLSDVLERAQRGDVEIDTVGVGLAVNRDALALLARESGGSCHLAADGAALREIYRRIPRDIQDSYTLTYRSTNTAHDGRFRRVAIQVKRPSAVVRARPGYYAPAP